MLHAGGRPHAKQHRLAHHMHSQALRATLNTTLGHGATATTTLEHGPIVNTNLVSHRLLALKRLELLMVVTCWGMHCAELAMTPHTAKKAGVALGSGHFWQRRIPPAHACARLLVSWGSLSAWWGPWPMRIGACPMRSGLSSSTVCILQQHAIRRGTCRSGGSRRKSSTTLYVSRCSAHCWAHQRTLCGNTLREIGCPSKCLDEPARPGFVWISFPISVSIHCRGFAAQPVHNSTEDNPGVKASRCCL